MTSPTDCWPTLSARDPRRLMTFLVEAFGFRVLVSYDDDTGGVAHAELATPGGRGGVMLGTVREGDTRGVAAPGTASAYVVVPDTEALFARATAAGAEVVQAPFDTDYGSRDCSLRDPEGGTWFFGTYAGHASG
jgi:uncharacterized glyoxalase superfamily protein PhnB